MEHYLTGEMDARKISGNNAMDCKILECIILYVWTIFTLTISSQSIYLHRTVFRQNNIDVERIFSEFINKNNSLLKYYYYLLEIVRNIGIKIIIMYVLLLCIPSFIHLHHHIDESIAFTQERLRNTDYYN